MLTPRFSLVIACMMIGAVCAAADTQTGCALPAKTAAIAAETKSIPAQMAPAAAPAAAQEPAAIAAPDIMSAPAPAIVTIPAEQSMTLANLQAAFNGESNATAQYLAYAKKADEEGYKKVAQLLRGAARAVEIHAAFLARNIADQKAVPTAVITKPAVRSTRENLEDALKSETDEVGSLYPSFLAKAQEENINGAAMAFGSAMKIAEPRRALYAAALKDLAAWKRAGAGFYVCKICGNLVERLDFAVCSVCEAPKSEFELIP